MAAKDRKKRWSGLAPAKFFSWGSRDVGSNMANSTSSGTASGGRPQITATFPRGMAHGPPTTMLQVTVSQHTNAAGPGGVKRVASPMDQSDTEKHFRPSTSPITPNANTHHHVFIDNNGMTCVQRGKIDHRAAMMANLANTPLPKKLRTS